MPLFNPHAVDYVFYLSTAIGGICLAYRFYVASTNYYLMHRAAQIDAARAQEGLPNEVTLTAEDFRQNPELAEIFDITDIDNNNLDINLETNEFVQLQEFQGATAGGIDPMAIIELITNLIN
jgi:hypothetical protein